MSARAYASGTVSFGLVSIPIKLYSTGEASTGIHLNMLHKKCGTRLKQQYVCPTDNEIVGKDEMVKGFEYTKGQYVLFSEDELKALMPEPTNAIDITEFIPLEKVDPIYFEKTYYLGPDKGGDRPYLLLSQAMRDTGRAAIARYRARGKDYLVLLRPYEQGVVMQQLRYADEIRSFSEVPIGSAEVKPQELNLAKMLIDQIAGESFEPAQYEDEVRKKTRALIDKKVEGEEITAAVEEAPKAQIIDLMAALKASLANAGGAAKGDAKAERKPAKPSPRKPGKAADEEKLAEVTPMRKRAARG
jgi:DNA end-binding protein Ku